jgi:tRNA pseudouridine38-40 synthase
MSEPVDLNVGGFTRLRIDFGYDGTDFFGWSKQPELRTIQAAFLEALTLIFGESEIDFSLRVAGRTDAGVHALHQVAHFDLTETQLARLGRETIDDIAYKLNRLLPRLAWHPPASMPDSARSTAATVTGSPTTCLSRTRSKPDSPWMSPGSSTSTP